MLIIGEKINATRKRIGQACNERNAELIVGTVKEQAGAGADYIDVNAGLAGKEVETMEWLLGLVQETTDLPIMLDSSDAEAMKKGLQLTKKKPIVNSISMEKERLEDFTPLLKEHDCGVVGLCVSDAGMPGGVDDRLATAEALIEHLTKTCGKKIEDIYLDLAVFPVSAQPKAPMDMALAIEKIMTKYPGVHTIAGLSNVSFGLPERRLLNLSFLTILISRGLDAAICDPNTSGLQATIAAAELLNNQDEFAMNYITAHREGKLTT
jgi:5-methyltetrahydrofolate--homocysteine methyltransferase